MKTLIFKLIGKFPTCTKIRYFWTLFLTWWLLVRSYWIKKESWLLRRLAHLKRSRSVCISNLRLWWARPALAGLSVLHLWQSRVLWLAQEIRALLIKTQDICSTRAPCLLLVILLFKIFRLIIKLRLRRHVLIKRHLLLVVKLLQVIKKLVRLLKVGCPLNIFLLHRVIRHPNSRIRLNISRL